MARALPSVKTRARKIAGRRFRRNFGESFLSGMGFSGSDFSRGGLVKGKFGLFTGPISKMVAGKASPGPAPTVQQPERVSNENKPSITTIIKQLNKLIKTASKIGVITKEQQEAILGQMAEARRIAKEQNLESKTTPIPEPISGASENITPLTNIVEELTTKLNELNGKVKEKNKEQDQNDSNNLGFADLFLDNYGLGDIYRKRKKRGARRAARAAGNLPSVFTVRGQALKQNASGRWIDAKTGRYASKDAAAIATRRQTSATQSMQRASPTSLSNKIGRFITLGFKKPAGAIGGDEAKIKRFASPTIKKAIGGAALAIPIVGITSASFAADKLVKGDPVSAGVPLSTGLGGPLAAMPALISATARDNYASIYGVQPENDPLVATRMPLVVKTIEDVAKKELEQSVDLMAKPTQDMVDRTSIPKTPIIPPPQKQTGPALTSINPPPATPPAGGGGGGGGAALNTSGGGASGSASSTGGQGMAAPSAATPIPSDNSAGTDLIKSSAAPAPTPIPNLYGFNQSQGRFTPQKMPTYKNGRAGIGNVPNPVYIPSDNILTTMFFNKQFQRQ